MRQKIQTLTILQRKVYNRGRDKHGKKKGFQYCKVYERKSRFGQKCMNYKGYKKEQKILRIIKRFKEGSTCDLKNLIAQEIERNFMFSHWICQGSFFKRETSNIVGPHRVPIEVWQHLDIEACCG